MTNTTTTTEVTAESLAAWLAAHIARIDAERTVSPEAQALAASWQPKSAAAPVRTMAELEADLDNHHINKLHRLTLAAIDAGRASDVRAFATSLTSACRQRAGDVRVFGDEPVLLADVMDDRAHEAEADAWWAKYNAYRTDRNARFAAQVERATNRRFTAEREALAA